MPASTFSYTTGSTIRKLMNTASPPVPRSHRSARMMKLATGTVRAASIGGRSRYSAQRHTAAATAHSVPAASARKKPPRMRAALKPTRCQNAAVGSSAASARHTSSGDASSSRCPTHTLASCQTHSQKQTAGTLPSRLFFDVPFSGFDCFKSFKSLKRSPSFRAVNRSFFTAKHPQW